MSLVVWIGAAMAALGVALLGVVILRARRLREASDPEARQAALHALVALNFGAVALGFLGLGVVLVGLLTAPGA
jgi:nitric oxide reductase large subunit